MWTERQRAMLQAMGLRVWSVPADPAPAEAREPVAEARPPAPALQSSPAPGPRPVPAPASAPTPPAGRPVTAAVAAPVAPAARPVPVAMAVPAELAALDLDGLRAAVGACQACGLCASRTQTVFGVGHPQAHWMIVGEAPGEQEDLRGEPFVGPAGQLLDNMLAALKLTRGTAPAAQQVFIANTLKCRPPSNRNPSPAELAQCVPYLQRQIALVQPRIILAMGKFAALALLGSEAPLGKLRGQVHHSAMAPGVPVVVSYHPAYLLRQPTEKAKAWEDLCLAASLYEAAIAEAAAG